MSGEWTRNPGLVSQVVTNLLQNVERHPYAATGGPAEVTLDAVDGHIVLDIADHRSGIATDVPALPPSRTA